MINSINSGVFQIAVPPTSKVPVQEIPEDVLVDVIGKKLSLPDFAVLAQVCKAWQTIIQSNLEKKLLEVVSFGKDKWLSIPGVESVSNESVLTNAQKKAIIAKSKGVCKFFNKLDSRKSHRFQNEKIKKTWQTHMLIFFPETINEKPRTVNSQNKLFHFIKEVDDGTACELIYGKEEDPFRTRPAPKSYWLWVTLDVIPGSRGLSYQGQERLLKWNGYRVPTLNEAVTSNLIMNSGFSKGENDYFFGKNEKDEQYQQYETYTATTELFSGFRMNVGGISSAGLVVYPGYEGSGDIGVAGTAEVPSSRNYKVIFDLFWRCLSALLPKIEQ